MSVPSNSTSPTPISVSDPTVVEGETSVVRLGKRLRDWIVGLSPTGATVYDTGLQTLITNAFVTVRARRTGRVVALYMTLPAPGAGGQIAALPAGAIPPALRPPAAAHGSGSGDQPGVATRQVLLTVYPDGSARLIKDSAVTADVFVSATYICDQAVGTSDPVALRAIAAARDHTAALAAADTALHEAAVDLADTRATLRDLTTIRREDTPA